MTALTDLRRHHKIEVNHLDRLAIVYVRQSTLAQLQHHQESTRLQYAYAVEFGVRRLGYSARALELSGGPDPTDELKSLWLLDGVIRQPFALFA